jgi:ketol-acid reductoisomerase
MYANCSTTAQRGALDWFERFYDANKPVFEQLYESVRTGNETRITLEANSRPDYRERLQKELDKVADDEIWQIGKIVRELRPENKGAKELKGAAAGVGIAGSSGSKKAAKKVGKKAGKIVKKKAKAGAR